MKTAEEQQIGLATELLTVILGLEEETLDRVIRLITDSQDIFDIKTDIILQRIGPRSTRYIRNAIEIARHEGLESHEHGTEEEPDTLKSDYLDQTSFDGRFPEKEDPTTDPEVEIEPTKEATMFTFKDFLEAEEVEDIEDLSSEDLQKKAQEMKKMAHLKSSGRGDYAEKKALRSLQQKLRTATDPRQKADLQRRIKELTTKSPEETM